jgi:hypothetical protein
VFSTSSLSLRTGSSLQDDVGKSFVLQVADGFTFWGFVGLKEDLLAKRHASEQLNPLTEYKIGGVPLRGKNKARFVIAD